MSVDLQRLCWRVEFPSPAMSAVAVKLADCANDEGENVYPSVGRIERETRLGESTVRRVLAAFEQSGLLEVVAETSGNKWNRSTTIRRFNLERLHDLTAREQRIDGKQVLLPSASVLKNLGTDTKPQWRVVPRIDGDGSDYAMPLPQREGRQPAAPPAAGPHPSQSGTPPLPLRDPTPPAAGPNPSIEPSLTLPPNPQGGEGEGECANQVWIDQLRDDGIALPQLEALIVPLLQTKRLRKEDHPDRLASLRAIRDGIAGIGPERLAKALAALMAERHVFPTLPVILKAIPAVSVAVSRAGRSNSELATDWQVVLSRLKEACGSDVYDNWFCGLGAASIDGGKLTIVAPTRFAAGWLNSHYKAEITAAVRGAFPNVTAIKFSSAPASGSAAP